MTLSATLGVSIRGRRARLPERELRDDECATGGAADEWTRLTRRELLSLGEAEWAWLGEHGVRRPSPPGVTQTDAARRAAGRVRIVGWLDGDDARKLDRIARGEPRIAVIARLIRAAKVS
jgi:hypothetical protein